MKFVSNESLNQLAKERDEMAKQRAAASKARAAGLGGELTDAKEIDALIKASQMNNSAVLSRLKEKNPDAVIYTASDEFKPKVGALARSVEAGWDTVKSGVGGAAKGAVGLATAGAELARNYNIVTGVAELVGGEFEKSVDGWVDQQNAQGRANAIAANEWIDDKVNLSKDTQLAQIAMAAQMKSDDSFWGTVKALYQNPSASGVMVADSLGQMVPYLVTGGGVAAAGRLGVGAVSGVASASIDYNATINEGVMKALSERGLAPTLANIRTITSDKEIMQPLAEKAVRRAAAVGAVSGIGAGVAGKMVASASTGVGKVGAAAGELVAQGAFEAGSEVAGQLAGDGRITDKGEIYAGAALGGVLSVPEFAQHAANARRVAAREKQIVEAAKNSEMYAEDAAFSEQIAAEQIAIESGSEEKYLPSHTLNQEQKAAVAAQYPQYAKAIEAGDTIKLTNEEYVGLIASDALPEASSLVRSHVDGLSEVEAQQMADNPFDASLIAQQVHDAQIASIKTRVMEGLQASTFKDADRAGYAELVGAFYDSTARRLGITPEELDSILGLQVKSNLGQPKTALNQERAGELMVTHAISADNLIKTLRNRNGDLLYPSLGISKEVIESFGEITLIGDKSMIDPESGATVWDRDSFTGMYPSTVNAPAQPVADRANAALETIKSLTGNTIKPSKSVDESIEYKQMFLSENGIEVDVDAIRSELNIDKLGNAVETGKKSDVPSEHAHLFEKTSPIGFASLVHSAKTGAVPYSNYVKKVDEQIAARKQEFDNFLAGLESEERDTFTGELATDEYILNALKGETIRKEDVNSISTMVGFYASQKSDIKDIRKQGKKLISAEERTKAFEDLQRKYYDSGMTIEEIMDSDSAKAKSIKNAAKKLGHFYMEAKPAEDRLNVSKFRAAVIPEGAPVEVENALRDAGLDVRRYSTDNRNEVVRNASAEHGLLFQNKLSATTRISEDRLRAAMAEGGLAYPSIAISKDGQSPKAFGDIELVFNKDSVGRVYDRDISSTMFDPKKSLSENVKAMKAGEISDGVWNEISNKISSLAKEIGIEGAKQRRDSLKDDGFNLKLLDTLEAAIDTEAERLGMNYDKLLSIVTDKDVNVYPSDATKKIAAIIKQLPTSYFEAKPNKDIVGANDIAMAVIPDDAPQSTMDLLSENRIRYIKESERDADAQYQSLLFQQNPELEANGWYNPETSTININASADMSTFIHESGHFFLDAYERLIAVDDSGVFQEELGRVLEWAGFDEGVDAWLSSTIEEKRETHEKFARGFEAYMREGRAPTPELNNIFRQFAEFLKVIYRSIRDLNVELSDSVRGVMDRMLVADELVETHGAQGDGVGEASARMQRILESDAEIRTKYNRERQAEERRITEQLMNQPEYQAMVALESGVDAAVIWEELGYSDEKAMLDAVRAAVPLDEAVKDLADQYIIDKYGEIPNAGKLAMHATASAYNTKTLESIASENPDKSVDYRTVTQAAKQFAQARIWGMKVVDLEPYRHSRAEQQIMRQIERRGATPELVIQRLQQAAMARATSRAKIEAEKRIKSLRKIAKTKSKTVDAEFYEQIQAILSYYELSDKPKREVREFGAFVAELEEQGMTLDVDVSLLRPQPVQDLTVSELNALYDVVKQIERAGRNKYRTIRAGKIRDVRKIQAEIQTNVEANWKGKAPRKHAARNWRESTMDVLDKYFVSNLRIGAIADVIDGGKTGAFHRHVLRPLQEAVNKEYILKKEVTKKLMEAIKPILSDKTEVRLSNGMVLGTEQRFVALLNMGNEGNMQRLVDGYRLTKEDIRLIVSSFTPEQLQAAQDIWDIYESMYPEVERIEMEITGKRPEKVEPKPLTVIASTGERITLRGGYYPAKYDTMADATSAAREEASQTLDQLKGKNGMKTLRKTFTKSRSEKVNRPILLSLSGMAQSMQEHIHMTTHAEALHDVKRIMSLKNPDGLTVMEVVHNKMGAQYSQYLRTWMDHVAAGVDSSYGDNIFKTLRSNAASSMMGFSALTMTAQVAGLVNSFGNLGFKNFFKGLGTVILHPMRAYREAFKRSEFLRNRQFTMYREASEVADKFTTSKLGRANKGIKQWAFAGIAVVQSVIDVITWYGSYSEALENGVSGKEAIEYADQSVVDIQGDQALINASTFERGGEAAKIFSMMSSYFTTLYNNLWMLNKSARHSALKKAWMNFFMLVVPSIAEKALRDAVQEDDEDKTLEERIIDYAVGGTIESALGMFIGVREVASVVSAVATDDPVFAYRGPAATILFSSTGKLAQQIEQGEADMALTNALIDAIGAATGLPAYQAKRMIRGIIALNQGKAESPTAVLYGYKGKLNEQ